MKRTCTALALLMLMSLSIFAQKATDGEVIPMNKQLFIEKVFDYTEQTDEWKYKGDKPAIIDLYANWCAPAARWRLSSGNWPRNMPERL